MPKEFEPIDSPAAAIPADATAVKTQKLAFLAPNTEKQLPDFPPDTAVSTSVRAAEENRSDNPPIGAVDDDDDLLLGDLLRASTQSKKQQQNPRSKKKVVAAPQLQQTFLDFGQQGIAHMSCPHCGLLFTTAPEDLAIHRRVCDVAAAAASRKRQRGAAGRNGVQIGKKVSHLRKLAARQSAADGLDRTIAALHASGRAQVRPMTQSFKHAAAMSARFEVLAVPLLDPSGVMDDDEEYRHIMSLLVGIGAEALLYSTVGRAGYVCVVLVDPAGSMCLAAAVGRSERRGQEPSIVMTNEPDEDGVLRMTTRRVQTTTECDVDYMYVRPQGADLLLSQRDSELVADLRRAPSTAAFFGSSAAISGAQDTLGDAAAVVGDPQLTAAVETVLLYLGKEVGPYGSPTPIHRLSFEAKLLHSPAVQLAALQRVLRDVLGKQDEGPYSHDLDEEAKAYDSSCSSASGSLDRDDMDDAAKSLVPTRQPLHSSGGVGVNKSSKGDVEEADDCNNEEGSLLDGLL